MKSLIDKCPLNLREPLAWAYIFAVVSIVCTTFGYGAEIIMKSGLFR